jgi:Bacterial Ig-like domain (group 3)
MDWRLGQLSLTYDRRSSVFRIHPYRARIAGALVGAVAVLPTVILGTASGAAAAPPADGTAMLFPATGDQGTIFSVQTDAQCPAGATNFIVSFAGGSGAGAVVPSGANLIGNSSLSTAGTASGGGLELQPTDTFQNLAGSNWGLSSLSGTYTYTVMCTNTSGFVNLQSFVGHVTFTPTAGTNSGTYVSSGSAAATPKTTSLTLTVSPAATAAAAASVTLTATATATAGTPVGSVQFKDGSTSIGNTVAVNASGVATTTTASLTTGSHSLTAVFTPSDATAFTAATSAAVSYAITAATTTNSPNPTDSPTPTPTTSGGSTSPTPAPTPDAKLTVTDTSGAPLGANPDLTPGQQVDITAKGFKPNEAVTATVHSTQAVVLTSANANSGGVVSYGFVVPGGLSKGAHTLALAGASNTVTFPFTIGGAVASSASGASLPFTGSTLGPTIVVGLALLVTGFAGIAFARRYGLLRFGKSE